MVLVLALVIGLANGYRRGLWLSLAQYLGMVAGVIAGAALAPGILGTLGITGSVARQVAAVLVLIVAGSLGSTFGYWLGEPLRRSVIQEGLSPRPEQLGGALFSGVTVLLTGWFLGLTFDRGPSPDISRLIQNSAILRGLDGTLPPPPGFLAGVQKVLAGVPFPSTFAGLAPTVPQPASLPTSTDTPGVAAARSVVYRVEGRGCGGVVTGSAYPIAPGYLITNAHVVAGTSNTVLNPGNDLARSIPASVVLFDQARDVAILYAPRVTAAPIPQAPDAGTGTQGAVIGYPGGGPEDVEAAAVDDQTEARGRDIYNDQLVDRQIWILQSIVRPGNSGGPLVDLSGRVVGLVFAASSTNPQQAYALTNGELASDIQKGTAGGLGPIDTAGLTCAV